MDSTGQQLCVCVCVCVCVCDDLKSRCFTIAYLGGPADKGIDLMLFISGLQTLDSFRFDTGLLTTAEVSVPDPGGPPSWS